VNLRQATLEDVDVIESLIRELADYERMADQVRLDPEVLKASLFDERPYAEVLLAEVDGDVAGFALFFHNFSTFLGKPGIYLEDLFVRPAFRRRGVGKALLSRLAELALERNCGRLEWAVLDWNQDAIKFYEGLGAKQLSEWRIFRLTGTDLGRLAGLSGR